MKFGRFFFLKNNDCRGWSHRFCRLLPSWGPFLKRPGNFSSLEVNLNIKQLFGPEKLPGLSTNRPHPVTFQARKLLLYVCRVYIQDQSFNTFENNKIKQSVNEAKLTSLWARNCAAIQHVWILKFALAFLLHKFTNILNTKTSTRSIRDGLLFQRIILLKL